MGYIVGLSNEHISNQAAYKEAFNQLTIEQDQVLVCSVDALQKKLLEGKLDNAPEVMVADFDWVNGLPLQQFLSNRFGCESQFQIPTLVTGSFFGVDQPRDNHSIKIIGNIDLEVCTTPAFPRIIEEFAKNVQQMFSQSPAERQTVIDRLVNDCQDDEKKTYKLQSVSQHLAALHNNGQSIIT